MRSDKFPKLELTIKFLDLAKNRYTQKYLLQFHSQFIQIGGLKNNDVLTRAHIVSTEIYAA